MNHELHLVDRLLVAGARLERAILVRGGFSRGDDTSHGPVDLLGAVNYACSGHPDIDAHSQEVFDLLVDVLGLEVCRHQWAVDVLAPWADTHSKEEALDLLDRARDHVDRRVSR